MKKLILVTLSLAFGSYLSGCNSTTVLGDGQPIQHETCEVMQTGMTSDNDWMLEDFLKVRGYSLVKESDNPVAYLNVGGAVHRSNFGAAEFNTYGFSYEVYYGGVEVFADSKFPYNEHDPAEGMKMFVNNVLADGEFEFPQCSRR